MAITKTDSDRMIRLAKEGKQISKIVSEDFPNLDYIDVYFEVYGQGERSSQGIKRMITTRINFIAEAGTKAERRQIAEELQGLVWHLYRNHKNNQEKIGNIRSVLTE